MIKIAAIGIITVIIAVFCKGIKSEYGIYVVFAGCLLLLFTGINRISGIVTLIQNFEEYLTISSLYVKSLLKMLGIAFIAEMTSAICKDAGYSSISSIVEFIGKLSIMLISAPIIEALFETIFSII